jgi:hypothetical protein
VGDVLGVCFDLYLDWIDFLIGFFTVVFDFGFWLDLGLDLCFGFGLDVCFGLDFCFGFGLDVCFGFGLDFCFGFGFDAGLRFDAGFGFDAGFRFDAGLDFCFVFDLASFDFFGTERFWLRAPPSI